MRQRGASSMNGLVHREESGSQNGFNRSYSGKHGYVNEQIYIPYKRLAVHGKLLTYILM